MAEKKFLRLETPTHPMDKRRVLVIDDEESFCSFASWALEKTGPYKVASATRPLQGIALAKTLRPDLILLDIKMPQMDGAHVAERLLEDPQTKSIPIAFVTGLVTNAETKHQQMEVAGRTFIAKPVTKDELLQAVGRLLA
jgi:CheY-like chemotaxis protein